MQRIIRYRVSEKKDARFSKLKSIPDLLSDDKECKKCEISTLNILAIGLLLWETL